MTIETTEDQLIKNLFTKRLRQDRYKDWRWYRISATTSKSALLVVRQLLEEGKKVKCGWIGTSVRGYRNYYVISK